MKLLYFVFVLVFSSLGIIPAYAEDVIWQNAVGVSINGNSLTATAPNGWGNSGASSTQSIQSGDGYITFTATETNKYRMIGLTNGDPNQDFVDGDFFIYLTGSLNVYENGSGVGTSTSYVTGDIIKIAIESGVVKYYRNDNLFYTSTQTPVYPLLVDTTFHSNGATINDVVINYNVIDSTPPIIALTGSNPYTIELGVGYAELGATTNDGSPVTIDSSAFSDSIGSYSILYDSVDSSGNDAVTVIRTVNVVEEIEPPNYILKNDLFYNHTRSNYNATADKITFTANKQQDIFSLFCNHFTSSTNEWDNQTSIISYDAEFLTKHTSYIRCYDESQNIILLQTVYKPYGITSGFDMINESFGNDGLFGVPFPFLIILIVASIWTGRNAQVGVIVTGATIGIMGVLGLFELPAEVWAMIVLLVAVGMFLGKKVF